MIDYICTKAERLKKKYDEDDPFRLAKAMGISVSYVPMGTAPCNSKGFLFMEKRIRDITINSDLPNSIRRIICAHELGHCVLHTEQSGIRQFHEFDLYNETSIAEYEANLFAAELLLSDGDVLEPEQAGASFCSERY